MFVLIFNVVSAALGWIYHKILKDVKHTWAAMPEVEVPESFTPNIPVSIVVAVRNEEAHVSTLTQALVSQEYPDDLYEILMINDHSEDNSKELLRSFRSEKIRVIDLEHQSGKKHALDLGIRNAQHDVILTTDADCTVSSQWLRTWSYFFQADHWVFACGPVVISSKPSLLGQFQSLESSGMIGVTGAGITSHQYYLANAANMSFTREAYLSVDGYSDNLEYASGDDMFLVQALSERYPSQIKYLKSKDVIVKTGAVDGMSSFFQQRMRWGSKNKAIRNLGFRSVTALVWFVNLILLINIGAVLVDFKQFAPGFLILIYLKCQSEFSYLRAMQSFTGVLVKPSKFVPIFLINAFYFVVAGILSMAVKRYHWKGRKLT